MIFKRLILVTGSSRGIGRAIVLNLNQTFASNVHFILMAQDSFELNKVKEKLIKDSNNQNLASIVEVDFSKKIEVADYFRMIKESLDKIDLTVFNELICIYNHGALEYGSVSLVAQGMLRRKFEINLFSVWNLLGAVNLFIPSSIIPRQFHVNITFDHSINPTPLWSALYTVRAAREMLFLCFLSENPGFRVLNYAPGFVLNDMFQEDDENTDFIGEKFNEKKDFLKPEETARKLVNILVQNSFKNGERLSFADLNAT